MRRPVRLPLEALQPFLLEQWPVVSGQWAVDSHCSLATDQCHYPLADCWPTIFGNDRPVEIEVGFGKGLFLVTAGSSRPDLNLLGIEIERKYALYVANRLAKRQLTNVRAVLRRCPAHLRTSGARGLRSSDPRLLSRSVVEAPPPQTPAVQRSLCPGVRSSFAPGGIFHLASDVAEYFDGNTANAGQADEPERPAGADASGTAARHGLSHQFRTEVSPRRTSDRASGVCERLGFTVPACLEGQAQ